MNNIIDRKSSNSLNKFEMDKNNNDVSNTTIEEDVSNEDVVQFASFKLLVSNS